MKRHKRFHFHFTPTSSSWLDQVERWFWDLTDKHLRRGIFGSVPELIAISSHTSTPTPPIPSPPVPDRITASLVRAQAHATNYETPLYVQRGLIPPTPTVHTPPFRFFANADAVFFMFDPLRVKVIRARSSPRCSMKAVCGMQTRLRRRGDGVVAQAR